MKHQNIMKDEPRYKNSIQILPLIFPAIQQQRQDQQDQVLIQAHNNNNNNNKKIW
ncbi:MAG: hypothetical protein ACJ72V_06045 [Nitrososphaeraceae archaeon]